LCHAAAAADETMIVSLTRSKLSYCEETNDKFFFSFFSSSDRRESFSQVKITFFFCFV